MDCRAGQITRAWWNLTPVYSRIGGPGRATASFGTGSVLSVPVMGRLDWIETEWGLWPRDFKEPQG
ncbi:hypothetical protein GCM10027256_07180 [Novispirillum itersonii subsp. nipponicum]